MPDTLNRYVRNRARERGLTLSELCARAGISRQTLCNLGKTPDKLPSLQTVVALADALHDHPLRLLDVIFDAPSLRSQFHGTHTR